jgi:hypothetical protein
MRFTLLFALFLAAESLFAGSDSDFIAPAGSSIYVDSNNGFDIFIQAAFQAKHLNVRLVSSADKADYVLDSSLFHSQEFLATQKTAGTYRISEAAFKLTSKSGDIVWAYAVTKGMLSRGKQSVAEACAKHLKDVFPNTK